MTKIVKSKTKISRRIGFSLWGRPNDSVHKRNYRPGQHGRTGLKKVSDFKKQCVAQRAMKAYYLMHEKQFRRFFFDAYSKPGNTADNLVGMLESRLSAVIHGAGLVPTVFAARQMVSHKHVKVNGRVVNRPSFLVKPGDEVTLTDQAKAFAVVKDQVSQAKPDRRDWLDIDLPNCEVRVLRVPKFDEVPYPGAMHPELVIEKYSK